MVHKLTKFLAKHFIQKKKHFMDEVLPEEVIELEYSIQEKKKNSSIVNLSNTDTDYLEDFFIKNDNLFSISKPFYKW